MPWLNLYPMCILYYTTHMKTTPETHFTYLDNDIAL